MQYGPKLLGACVIAVSLGTVAHSQEVSQDIVNATVGEWLIISEDGSPGCHVTLGKDKTIGGRVVTEGKVCAAPWHDQIAAWDFGGPGIVLRDATRKEIIGFGEREVGPWVTDIEQSPRVYFVPQPGQMDRAATETGAVGNWLLTDKKGKALCHLSLLDKASKRSDDSKSAVIGKDCTAGVRKMNIDAWQIDEIILQIIGGEIYVYSMIANKDGFVTQDGKFYLTRDR